MDPLSDWTDSDRRGLPLSPVADEFSEPDDGGASNISIIRSVHIFLNEGLPDRWSCSRLNSVPLGNHTNDEDPPSTDPLNVEINYAEIEQDQVETSSEDGMEVVPGDGGIRIKQELEWKDEEIDIVDDHLDNLSKSPRKRIAELKLLLRKETEENVEGVNETEGNADAGRRNRYSLRKRTRENWGSVLSLKSACETSRDEYGNIWSDDSDNDPDYAPQYEELEDESHKDCKTERRLTMSVKQSYRRKFKKIACIYCKKKYKAIVKHLMIGHPNKPEVQNIITLPMRSKERKEALIALLKEIEENPNEETNKGNRAEQQKREIIASEDKSNGSQKTKLYAISKVSVCFYCKKRSSKVSRHLMLIHKNEPYIKYLMRLPKGSEKRKSAFRLIRNKGNFAYNQEVIANGEGSIISLRRQNTQDQIHSFASCSYCFGFFKKSLILRHEEKCFKTFSCEDNFDDGTINGEGEGILPSGCPLSEECLEKTNEIQKKKKRRRRILKPPPANRKVSACFYCRERVHFISKHLIQHHGDKPYMIKLLSLPKGSEERKTAWKLIRNRGNFVYNKEIIANRGGPIITSKMQKGQDQFVDFLPCCYCLGFFKKKFLQRHKENCLKISECKALIVNDKTKDRDTIPTDCSPMDIIQNLVKGNLVGDEIDIDLKIKKTLSKRTACYYCNKHTTKFVRHLELFHSDKPDVKNVLSLEKGSKERYHALQAIRRKGNFLFNKITVNTAGGTLITPRTSQGSNKLKYLPCEYCFGFFTLNTLIKHIYKCEMNTMSTEAKNEKMKKISELKRKGEIKTFNTTLLNSPTSLSPNIDRILLSLGNSKIAAVAKNDKLIIKYGTYLLERGKMSTNLIARKMCCLAKLVVRVNVFESSVTNLIESLTADFFKTVLKAALQICITTKENIAIRREKSLRTSIRHCCMMAKSDSLIQKEDTALKHINNFFALFIEHWSEPLLPIMFEASKITRSKEKVSESGPNAGINSNASLIDHIKQDFLQHFRGNESPVSSTDIDHCSSRFGTKKNVCLFCNRKYEKLFRHWTRSHQDEPEVKKLAKFEKFSREWKLLVIALRNKGNYLHNKSVLQQKRGCLFRKQGRAVLNGYREYIPCEYCLGFYKAKSLSLHFKRCPLNPLLEQGAPINMRIRKWVQTSLIMNAFGNEPPTFKAMIDQMKNDSLKRVVRKDDLIMKYGRIYTSHKPKHKRSYHEVSYRLRNLAKILGLCQKRMNQIKTLSDCFQPERFGYVLGIMKEMSLSRCSKLSALNLFLQLRSTILSCCLILKNEWFLNNNESKLKKLNDCEVMLTQCVLSAQDLKQHNESSSSQVVDNTVSYGGTVTPKKKVKNWGKEEIDAISSQFSSHIQNGVMPGKLEIEGFLNQHENLKSREWMGVKHQIRNMIATIKRKRYNFSSPFEGKESNSVGSRIDANSSETHSNVFKQNNCATFGPHKLKHIDEFQAKTPENEVTPSVVHEENKKPKCIEDFNEQHSTRISDDSLMKDLEDLCDEISLPSLHKPLAIAGNQKDNCTNNCPSDDEERTYIILSSGNYSEEGNRLNIQVPRDSVVTTSNTCKDAIGDSYSYEQPIEIGLSAIAPITSLCQTKTQELQTNNDIVAVYQNESNSLISTKPEDSISNQSKCHKLNSEEGRGSHQKQNKESSVVYNGSNNNSISHISPIPYNRYQNKGLHRQWRDDEINAVMSFFSKHIKNGKIPSKVDCLDCIEENQCLELRDWVSVKSKVYNIIKSNKKISFKTCEKNGNSVETNAENVSLDITDSHGNTCESDLNISFVISNNKNKISLKKIRKEQWTLENVAIDTFLKDHINNHTDIVENATLNTLKCKESNAEEGKYSNKKENEQSCVLSNDRINPTSPSVRYNRQKNKRKHSEWNDDEIIAVLSFFSSNINNSQLPSKVECLDCIEENQCLNLRDWTSVKSKVCTIIRSNKKTNLNASEKNKNFMNTTEENESIDVTDTHDDNACEFDSSIDFTSSNNKDKTSLKGVVKQPWTTEENAAIDNFFKDHINNRTVPGKKDCEQCLSLNECLASRSWVMVKSKVHNIITSKKRKRL